MGRQTFNQISTLPFENNIVANALSLEDKSAQVYDLSNGYNTIDFLIGRTGTSRRINGKDGVFSKPIMGVSVVQAQIASTSLNGTLLRVNFTDPTYDKFRLTEVVGDGSAAMTMGKVVDKGPGFIELEVAPPVTAWNTANHFKAGQYATVYWNAQKNRGSGAMSSLYEYPKYVSNKTAIIRENVELYRRDMADTWVQFEGKDWYSAQDMMMLKRISRELEWRSILSSYGSSPDGNTSYSMGAFAAIKDPERGGVHQALANLPTQSDVESFLGEIADRQSESDVEINLVVGRGWLNRLQSFTSDYIKYSGKQNTFGGESVKGLDVRMYAINGITANIIQAPIFNDRERFPGLSLISGSSQYTRFQYTALALDLNPYEAVDGGSLPAMEKVYFGDEEMIYYYTPGIIGTNLQGGDGKMLRNGDMRLALKHEDCVTTGFYSDCAHDFMATRMGLQELAY